MKFASVSFHCIRKNEVELVARRHRSDAPLYERIAEAGTVLHVKRIRRDATVPAHASDEKYFPGSTSFYALPLQLCLYLKGQKPGIVLVHGFIFPLQFLVLKLFLPGKTRFIIQHHAEGLLSNPFKRLLQVIVYRGAHLYLFTAQELAEPFLKSGIIRDTQKSKEIMEVSSIIEPIERGAARRMLSIPDRTVFLWVSRLIGKKDPMTALRAIVSLKKIRHDFTVYMIYSDEQLEGDVRTFVTTNALDENVVLLGKRPHEEMHLWFSAADYFLAASHYEGSGVALCEAMACGCVPVVTDIPAFKTMTRSGSCGFLYRAGNEGALSEILTGLPVQADQRLSAMARRIFNEDLSPAAISEKLYEAVKGC